MAQREGIVASILFVPDNEKRRDKRNRAPKGRPLNLDEMARLFRCAKEEHLRTFMTIMINTLCRPEAALDLGPNQIDLMWNVVDLNPEGRIQTNKYRPKVPITKALRSALTGRDVKTFVNYKGRRVRENKKGWRTMVAESGLPNSDKIKPYSIRHTMARELGARGISNEHIGLFLGHLPTGSAATTAIYNPYQPQYLTEAAIAVDCYVEELRLEIERQERARQPEVSEAQGAACLIQSESGRLSDHLR